MLPVGVYLVVTEASSRQATVGKRVLKMRVVARDLVPGTGLAHPGPHDREAASLEFAHFFVWHTVAAAGDGFFPAWLIAGLVVADVLPVAYVLTVLLELLLSPERRSPHDLVAGTRVVRA